MKPIGYYSSSDLARKLAEAYGEYGQNMDAKTAADLICEISIDVTVGYYPNVDVLPWLVQVVQRHAI